MTGRACTRCKGECDRADRKYCAPCRAWCARAAKTPAALRAKAKYRASDKYKNRIANMPAGRRAEYEARARAKTRAWVASLSAPERRAWNFKSKLRSVYKMSAEEFWQMFENQEGLCAVCSRLLCVCGDMKCRSKACVEHDHGTNKVRGLTCPDCNSTIGYAHDSPTVLRNAATYLEAS
jgi:hypothetical protein